MIRSYLRLPGCHELPCSALTSVAARSTRPQYCKSSALPYPGNWTCRHALSWTSSRRTTARRATPSDSAPPDPWKTSPQHDEKQHTPPSAAPPAPVPLPPQMSKDESASATADIKTPSSATNPAALITPMPSAIHPAQSVPSSLPHHDVEQAAPQVEGNNPPLLPSIPEQQSFANYAPAAVAAMGPASEPTAKAQARLHGNNANSFVQPIGRDDSSYNSSSEIAPLIASTKVPYEEKARKRKPWDSIPLPPSISQLLERLRDVSALLAGAIEVAGHQLDQTWFKVLFLFSFVSGLISLVLTLVVVPLINWEAVPKWNVQVSELLERQVTLGRIHQVSLLGMTGLVPLVRAGPLSVGPAPNEHSHLTAPSLAVYLDPIQSLVNHQAVLKVHADGPQLNVVQRPNFSWFGYPEDTSPTSRDFVPGMWRETNWEASLLAKPLSVVVEAVGDPSLPSPPPSSLLPKQPTFMQSSDSSSSSLQQKQKQKQQQKQQASQQLQQQELATEHSAIPRPTVAPFTRPTMNTPTTINIAAGKAAVTLAPSPSAECTPSGLLSTTLFGAEAVTTATGATQTLHEHSMMSDKAISPTTQPANPDGAASDQAASDSKHSEEHDNPLEPSAYCSNAAPASGSQPAQMYCTASEDASLLQQQQQQQQQQPPPPSAMLAAPSSPAPTHASTEGPSTKLTVQRCKQQSSPQNSCPAVSGTCSTGVPPLASMCALNSWLQKAPAVRVPGVQWLTEAIECTAQDLVKWLAAYDIKQLLPAGTMPRAAAQRAQADLSVMHGVHGAADVASFDDYLLASMAVNDTGNAAVLGAITERLPYQANASTSSINDFELANNEQRWCTRGTSVQRHSMWDRQQLQHQLRAHTSLHMHHQQNQTGGMTKAGHEVRRESRRSEPAVCQQGGSASMVGSKPVNIQQTGSGLISCFAQDNNTGGTGQAPGDTVLDEALQEDLTFPPVALGTLSVRGAFVNVFVVGERLPRRFESVDADLHLGKGYTSIELQLEGDAHERDIRSNKLTLVSPYAKRHLRHVTPGATTASGVPSLRYACDNLPKGVVCKLRQLPLHSSVAMRLPMSPSCAKGEDAGAASSTARSVLADQTELTSGSSGSVAGAKTQLSPWEPIPTTAAVEVGVPTDTTQQQQQQQQQQQMVLADFQELIRTTKQATSPSQLPLLPPLLATPGMESTAGEQPVAPLGSLAKAVQQLRPAGSSGRRNSHELDEITNTSLRTYGMLQPVVENDGSGSIGTGHPLGEEAIEAEASVANQTIRQGVAKTALKDKAAGAKQTHHPPSGGRLRMQLSARGMFTPNVWPDLSVTVRGDSLHAPLIERLVELPMDVAAGRVSGEFRLRSHDTASWGFPEFYGKIRCRGIDLHFWDSPDDLLATDMDLVFERDRMYLHGAQGHFGAIPLRVTGDMDMNPETGAYRLSATVPGVEVNALRATLGIRPMPMAVAGAIRGVLHLTGPLEKPVFSGSAVAVRPTAAMLAGSEDTPALAALLASPDAVAGYDQVPLVAASGVFTLDTAAEMFALHSAQVQPAGGGHLAVSGRMWVSPTAENDPRAISMQYDASGIDADLLAGFYMPSDVSLPSTLDLGRANVTGTFAGSHVAPKVQARFEAPAGRVAGSVELGPAAMALTAHAPAFAVEAKVLTSQPDAERARNADTQAEATLYSKPRFEGCDVAVNIQSVDLLPIAFATTPTDPLSNGQPLRAKVKGAARLSLRPTAPSPAQAQLALQSHTTVVRGTHKPLLDILPGALFEGPVSLSGIRINQLELVHALAGSMAISNTKVAMRSSAGSHVAPVLAPTLAPLPQRGGGGFGSQSGEAFDLEVAVDNLAEALNLARLPTQAEVADDAQDSHVLLRCGPLLLSSDIYNGGSELHIQVQNLQLDDLEVGSLRGRLVSAQLDADVDARQGRAAITMEKPRYASVQASSVAGSLRWEGDIVKLEETVLQQANSRYEFSGEIFLPDILPASLCSSAAAAAGATTSSCSSTAVGPSHLVGQHLPASAALLGTGGGDGGDKDEAGTRWWDATPAPPVAAPMGSEEELGSSAAAGRWRLQVAVPHAELQDLLPAVQALSAGNKPGREYGIAKRQFLDTLAASGTLRAQDLRLQVDSLLSRHTEQRHTATSGHAARPASLPGLQDLQGAWSGNMQLHGGPNGANNVDFNLRGREWHWGSYTLDSLVAAGDVDGAEGVQLDELSLAAGNARLLLQGNLLCARQDAALMVSDFPLALLQPLYSALPALRSATVSAEAKGARPGGYFAPLTGLTKRFEATLQNLGLKVPGQPDPLATLPASPVEGQLFVTGHLGGSTSIPEATLDVRIEDGAIGDTQLAHAQASLSVDKQQRITVDIDMAPMALAGHLRLAGGAYLPASIAARLKHGRSSAAAAVTPVTGGGFGTDSGPSNSVANKFASAATNTTSEGLLATETTAGGVHGRVASANDGSAANVACEAQEEQCDVQLHIKDGGMALLSALVPECEWQGGTAGIAVRVHGDLQAPEVEGSAQLSKGVIVSPLLKYPVTCLTGSVNFSDGTLTSPGIEARLGKAGVFRLRGELPILQTTGFFEDMNDSDTSVNHAFKPLLSLVRGESVAAGSAAIPAAATATAAFDADGVKPGSMALGDLSDVLTSSEGFGEDEGSADGLPSYEEGNGFTLELENVEMRVRNVYTGSLDAKLAVRQSLSAPVLGGWLRFSKGIAFLLPPQQHGSVGRDTGAITTPETPSNGHPHHHQAAGSGTSGSASCGLMTGGSNTEAERELVSQAFAMLKAGRKRAILSSLHPVADPPTDVETARPGNMSELQLAGLEMHLGPDLRAVFPVVLNVGVSGQVTLSGAADPAHLVASGVLRLDGGTLNLVASQFHLDREHANRIVLSPEAGLDPSVDVVLVSGDLRAVIQGRASNWQDSLVLSASGTTISGAGNGGTGAVGTGAATAAVRGKAGVPPPDVAGAVEPSAVARVFEERLAEALLGENGQLALRSLASSTFVSLLPKIETHGQLGRARWRLVGAPSLPSLLSLDPVADPQKFLSSLALGTEVEVQFGKALQAALVHKLQETGMGTEVTLTLQLSRNVRLQAHVARCMPTILLQYSSEGTPEATRVDST